MSLLTRPAVARPIALGIQQIVRLASGLAERPLFPDLVARRTELSVPTSYGDAPCAVYAPPAGTANPAVHVNLHGGGFILGFPAQDDPLCRYLAEHAGVVVVNVDYVLAPRHPFPAAPEQAYEVVRWVAEHAAEQGWDASRLSVGGQSAGGALAAAVARQALRHGGPDLRLQVLHYPVLDLVTGPRAKSTKYPEARKPMLRPWMMDVFNTAYLPDPALRSDPLASPAHVHDDADLTGIAPALVVTAELDVLRAEGIAYADRLRAAGALLEVHDVAGMDHGYDKLNRDKAAIREAYELICTYVRPS